MKIFARYRKLNNIKMPYNINIANSMQGFYELGFEIIPYHTIDEIYDKYEKGDIVLDGILQVKQCLQKFGIEPQDINYPDILQPYLGRKIWTDNINHISSSPELWPIFVKPVKEKVFTGKVITSIKDLAGCGSYYENFEVLCSEPVEFIYEVRCFILYDKIIDIRPYYGDWQSSKYLNIDLIYKAMEDFKKWDTRPHACTLDFGMTKDKKTLFIEQNPAYAFGCYGLTPINHAKMISAYTAQLFNIPDECLN